MSDPLQFQRVPFEPEVGDYAILANVKAPQYVFLDRQKIPVELFEKHKQLLLRSYHERQPNREWDLEYAAFARHMKDIAEPELHPEKWMKEAEKIIPYTYNDRVGKANKFAPYQRDQYNTVLELLSKTRAVIVADSNQKAITHAHTATQVDLAKFFESPKPAEAVLTFPKVPQHQREQWFDLLIHFTIGANLAPEAESLKRCFSSEQRLLRDFHHTHPCFGAAERYRAGWEHWRGLFDKLHAQNSICQVEKQTLRSAMIEIPDWNRAKYSYEKFTYCVNTRKHKEDILGHMRREPPTTYETPSVLEWTWVKNNLQKNLWGDFGPRSGTYLHSQEDADKLKAEYEEGIKV